MGEKHKTSGLNEDGDLTLEAIISLNRAVGDILIVDDFLNYAIKKGASKKEELIDGYKLALETLLRVILDHFENNNSMGLTEDFVFYRAKFVGVNPKKVPSTCDKMNIAKNIYELIGLIRKVKNFNQSKNILERIEQFYLTLKNLEKYILFNKNFNMSFEEAMNNLKKFYVYISLNDLRNSMPWGVRFSMLQVNYNKRYFNTALIGYKYVLEYLWFKLLGNDIKRYGLDNIHNAKNWKEIDNFFDIIRNQIILPIEKEYGSKIWDGNLFKLSNKFSKSVLNPLLKYPSKPRMTKKDEFYYTLLWYPNYSILDSSSNIFNGAPLFITILRGLIAMKEDEDMPDKIYVAKIIHTDIEEKYNITYGVLIYAFGHLTDSSGWLFTTPLSGREKYNEMNLEEFLSFYEKRGYLEVRKIELSFKKFEEYLKTMERELIFNDGDLPKLYRMMYGSGEIDPINFLMGQNDELRGFAFEGLCYYVASKLYGKEWNVEWHLSKNKQEYDLVLVNKKKGDVIIVECKTNINNESVEGLSKNLQNKLNSYPADSKTIEVWTWIPPFSKVEELLKKENIKWKVISEIVKTMPDLRTRKMQKMLELLGNAKEYQQLEEIINVLVENVGDELEIISEEDSNE